MTGAVERSNRTPEVAGSSPAPVTGKALETAGFAPTRLRLVNAPRHPGERTFRMSKAKRTTMSKMNRERELKEKRARKQERKEHKKLVAAAAAANANETEAPAATPSA